MKYKKALELAKKNNISILDLEIADAVSSTLKNENDNNFEMICSYIEKAYLESENIRLYQLVNHFKKLNVEEEYSIEEILNLPYYKFLDGVNYY